MNDLEEIESTHDLTTKDHDWIYEASSPHDEVAIAQHRIVFIETPQAIYEPKADISKTSFIKIPRFADQTKAVNLTGIESQKQAGNENDVNDRITDLKAEIQLLNEQDLETKKICGCFPRTRRGILCGTALLGFMLISIGIILFFLWPRIPDFHLESVRATQTEPIVTGSDLNFTVEYPLILKFKVHNPNYYNIKTNNIVINAFISPNLTLLSQTNYPGSLLTQKVNDYKIGQSLLKNKNFPRGETTFLNATLLIDYKPNPKYGVLNDPSLGEILRICSDKGRKSKDTVRIVNNIEIDIGILASFGYRPRIIKDVNIQCPISSAALKQLSLKGIFNV